MIEKKRKTNEINFMKKLKMLIKLEKKKNYINKEDKIYKKMLITDYIFIRKKNIIKKLYMYVFFCKNILNFSNKMSYLPYNNKLLYENNNLLLETNNKFYKNHHQIIKYKNKIYKITSGKDKIYLIKKTRGHMAHF